MMGLPGGPSVLSNYATFPSYSLWLSALPPLLPSIPSVYVPPFSISTNSPTTSSTGPPTFPRVPPQSLGTVHTTSQYTESSESEPNTVTQGEASTSMVTTSNDAAPIISSYLAPSSNAISLSTSQTTASSTSDNTASNSPVVASVTLTRTQVSTIVATDASGTFTSLESYIIGSVVESTIWTDASIPSSSSAGISSEESVSHSQPNTPKILAGVFGALGIVFLLIGLLLLQRYRRRHRTQQFHDSWFDHTQRPDSTMSTVFFASPPDLMRRPLSSSPGSTTSASDSGFLTAEEGMDEGKSLAANALALTIAWPGGQSVSRMSAQSLLPSPYERSSIPVRNGRTILSVIQETGMSDAGDSNLEAGAGS
ncbi:uncharacterized protein FIBRA_00903 [Fibroporia radiculosa]|uniref:Uncharacterized protein n=1 Tax=Fibroporia radiculosa TaxID=599839 RepID=J4I870_9APHY|nr:uncharacterized protein FIBRA_00903 [Fibroporia radiculosa]CCL98896.1 predicted protein [Fibroporia radiculosa]